MHKQTKREVKNAEALDNIYYVQSANVISNLRQSNSFESINSDVDKSLNSDIHDSETVNIKAPATGDGSRINIDANLSEDSSMNGQEINDDDVAVIDESKSNNDTNSLHRVKRKSGKTTGALRPKSAGESSTKNTSRKKGEGELYITLFLYVFMFILFTAEHFIALYKYKNNL